MTAAIVSAAQKPRSAAIVSGLREFLKHPGALCGTIVLAIFIICAIFAPWLAPFDPSETDIGMRLGEPDAITWFGADLHGRDIFSRVIWGARYSLPVGFATLIVGLIIGGTFGVMLGYIGGRFDAVCSRVIDVLLGFPSIVLAIMVVAVLGVGLVNVVVAVAIAEIPRFARVIRGAVLVAKQNLYVEAALAMGASSTRVMFLHILPAIMPTVIVLGTLNLGNAILSTATLSFLGLGAQPPAPEWGAMLNSGREYMRYAPWTMIAPGLALFLAVIAVNLIGDRLSEVIDPRNARRR